MSKRHSTYLAASLTALVKVRPDDLRWIFFFFFLHDGEDEVDSLPPGQHNAVIFTFKMLKHMYNSQKKSIWLQNHWIKTPTFLFSSVHFHLCVCVWFLPFLCRWHYPWLHVDVSFSTRFELNEKWRWVSGELLRERPGLMCSQRMAWDPSSACLNRAAGFVQTGVHLQQRALYKPLLHGPLERGHSRSFNMRITMVTHMYRQTCLQGEMRNIATCDSHFKAVYLNRGGQLSCQKGHIGV